MKSIYLFLILIQLGVTSCWRKVYTHKQPAAKLYTLKSTDSTATYDAYLKPYRTEMQAKMNVIVGESNLQLVKSKPDGNLGHMVCDAMYYATKRKNFACDASMCNYGGIRIPSVAKGNISLGTVYEIMPFDNELLVLSLTGVQLDSLCQNIARSGGMPVSHITFNIAQSTAQNIFINNEALQHNKTYNIVVSDYMANGGDNMSSLKNLPRTEVKVLLRDAIIDYIKYCKANNQQLVQENEKRITQQK
jgi:2',3'-cyclic-nucleotide 2'-phosphodiesterase (5'-nucleotidase family)